jgi:hypothetical protein
MVKQLVEKNPGHLVDCIGVGIYLLDLHPHLWTVIANTEDFSMNHDYYPNHRSLYTNFLACNHFVERVSSTKNPKDLTPAQLEAILRTTAEKSRADFEARCDQSPLPIQFRFKNIVSDAKPAPRYNNSKTNIGEMFGNLMKQNGARYKNPVLFLHHALRLYNKQVLQLKRDLNTFKHAGLTTIGHKIKLMTGKEYRGSQKRATMWESNLEHGVPSNHDGDDDGWDRFVGDFAYEGGGVGDNYKAFLTWDSTCAVFHHSCSEHGSMSDMLMCPCYCIFLLCIEAIQQNHLPKKFKTATDIEPYLYGPCFRSDFCIKLLERKYKNLRGLRLSIPSASDTINSRILTRASYSSAGALLNGNEVCCNLRQPTKYKESFSGGPRFTSSGEFGQGNSVLSPHKSNKSHEGGGRFANCKTSLVKFERVTKKLPNILIKAKKIDTSSTTAAEIDAEIDAENDDDESQNNVGSERLVKIKIEKNDDGSFVDESKNNVGSEGLVKVKIEKDDHGSSVKVRNNDANDHGFSGLDIADFFLSQTTEEAMSTVFQDKHPKHCSSCGSTTHNIMRCVSLHTNGLEVCPARLLVPGNYHVYCAPHTYSHHQSGFPVELYAQSDPRTNKYDKIFDTFEEVGDVDDVEEGDPSSERTITTLNNKTPSCFLADLDKKNISKNQPDNENQLDEANYESSDNRFTNDLNQNLEQDIYEHQTYVRPQWGNSVLLSVYATFSNLSPSDHILSIGDHALTVSQSSQKTVVEELTRGELTQTWMMADDDNESSSCIQYSIDHAFKHVSKLDYGKLPVWFHFISNKLVEQTPSSEVAQYTGTRSKEICSVDRRGLESLILKPGQYVEDGIIQFFGNLLVDLDPEHFGMVDPTQFLNAFPLHQVMGTLLGNRHVYSIKETYSVAGLVKDLSKNLVPYSPKGDGIEPGLGIISIPIFCPEHWILCIVFTDSGRVIMLDTWKEDVNYGHRQNFYTVAVPAFLQKYIAPEDPEKVWSVEWPNCPVQTSSDCGVFVCVFMYIFAVLHSGDFDKTLSLICRIDQEFLSNNPIRHLIALCILKSDISYMNLKDQSRYYSKEVIAGRKYTREDLGLTLQLLTKTITDKVAMIRYPLVTDFKTIIEEKKIDFTILSVSKFVGSLLTTQELRGYTLDYCHKRAHNFKKVGFDYEVYGRVQNAIILYEGQRQNVTRQKSSRLPKTKSAWATDSIIDMASYWIMRDEDYSKRLFFPVRKGVLDSWKAARDKKISSWPQIKALFPLYFRMPDLLQFRCIAFPILRSEHYTVMFVLNLSSLWKETEGSIPVIYHFDSGTSCPDEMKQCACVVRSFLNKIIRNIKPVVSKHGLPIKSPVQDITLDAKNLPLYEVPVRKQKSAFECGYFVIMYIAIMYRKVVSGNFKGVGQIGGETIHPTPKSITDILLACDSPDKCLSIMKDLHLLFTALNNILVKITSVREASNKQSNDDCSDEDDDDSFSVKITGVREASNRQSNDDCSNEDDNDSFTNDDLDRTNDSAHNADIDSKKNDDTNNSNNDDFNSNSDKSFVNVDIDDSTETCSLQLQKFVPVKRMKKKTF